MEPAQGEQTMDDLLTTRKTMREQVCTDCFRKPEEPAGSITGDHAFSCEPSCDLFTYLPRLAAMVHQYGGEPPCGYESVVHNLPCRSCNSSTSCSDDNDCRSHRPLEKYAGQALAVLEWIERHGSDPV
jgi:hypothetical protein